jgi:hypothetical protein
VTMTARCKFQITSILPAYPNTDPSSDAKRVVFETRYDNTVAEDQAFTKYTPTGRMDVMIDNPSVTNQFAVGDNVYIDITKI